MNTVAIIWDDPGILETIADDLRESMPTLRVETFGNALDALQWDGRPDAVLLDVSAAAPDGEPSPYRCTIGMLMDHFAGATVFISSAIGGWAQTVAEAWPGSVFACLFGGDWLTLGDTVGGRFAALLRTYGVVEDRNNE